MEIILLQNVEGLGERGDQVHVAGGYFRNYLGPKGLAVLASEGEKKRVAEEDRVRALRKKKHLDLAGKAAADINGTELEFRMKVGEDGQLFGSVNSLMIAQELESKGKKVPSKNILLDEPIKTLREEPMDVTVRFPHDVSAVIKVKVVAD